MSKSSIAAALCFLSLAVMPLPAVAQGHDRHCQRVVDRLCEGASVGSCFDDAAMWDNIPERCTADVQTMIEMEREANEQSIDTGSNGQTFSCGGILRSRASMNSSKVASVAAGQVFDSVEETGVWTDGYQWFFVSYDGYEGYQWGGIFWTEGGREGTIPSCDG